MRNLMRFSSFGLAALLTIAQLGAISATVSGRWSGTIDIEDPGSGTTITTPVQVEFIEKDGVLSGKIGRKDEPDNAPIQNAKVENGHLHFEATSLEVNGPVKFDLTLTGDQMQGEMKASVDSDDLVGKVKISREKQ
jgi:hypothetical protein